MDTVSDKLAQIHYSMRTLIDSEGIVRGLREVPDYGHRFGQLSPAIKVISANTIQTLQKQGSVWVPIDIFFGPAETGKEKLHFLIVHLFKNAVHNQSFKTGSIGKVHSRSQGNEELLEKCTFTFVPLRL